MERADREMGAVVLAGGLSRRMGVNKALLRIRQNSPTIIELVVARLTEAGLRPTLLVTNTPGDYASLDIPMMPDDIEGAGALGGIFTALSHSPYMHNLIVGCDMPFLNPSLLMYMAALPGGDSDALVPRWAAPGGPTRVETLHAIYSVRCIAPIRSRITQGKLKLSDLLQDIRVHYIEEPELRRYDPNLCSFRNINTPEELEKASGV